MYLFDTDIVSYLTRRFPIQPVYDRFHAAPAANRFISAITVMELRRGARLHPAGDALWQRIVNEIFPFVEIIPVAKDEAVGAADLQARMQLAGQILPEADTIIAATALVHNLILITRNIRHFERITEVRLENWFV